MPESVIMTQELIDSYPYKSSKGSSGYLHPDRPFCKLCGCLDTRIFVRQGVKSTPVYYVSILPKGSEAIRVIFKNGTIAYYEPSCWSNLANSDRVKRILAQERKTKPQT